MRGSGTIRSIPRGSRADSDPPEQESMTHFTKMTQRFARSSAATRLRRIVDMSEVRDHQRLVEWFDHVCRDVHGRLGSLNAGELASYIPELAQVDPDRFAIATVTVNGESTLMGDHDHPFTIQSISKLLLYGLALETHGREAVLRRAGVAPTGDPFNAIELDEGRHRAPNPMVNSGAIAVTDMVEGNGLDERTDVVLSLFERYLGRRPDVDRAVCSSEYSTGNRNRAIGYLLLNQGIVDDRVEETLDLYFLQCSILITAADLALIGATIANNGVQPLSGERIVGPKVARDMLTVALTCGMYDYAGEWAYTVGIPAKGGVGGGIVGMIPDVGGVAAYSPRLDEHGNSVRGVRVFEELSREFDLHVFDADRPWIRRA